MTQRQLRNIYRFVAVMVFVYLCIRSFTVPISHDEAATFFHYIQSGKFVPYAAHWDANNHFLNSLLVYPLYKIFGSNLFWLRLPNLLFFILYAVYSFKLTKPIVDNFIRLSTSVALITAPYIIEFFAQSRGYGMSIALLATIVLTTNRFLMTKRPSDQLGIWFLMILAMMANMALMNSYIILLAVVAVTLAYSVRGAYVKMNWIYFGLFGILPFLAAAKYAFAMREKALLYAGSTDGFIEVTVNSLLQKEFHLHSITAAWIISIITVIAAIIVLIPFAIKKYTYSNPGVVSAILLIGNVAGAISLQVLFDVNYPEDRIALYYVPLFILTIGYAVFYLSQQFYHHLRWLSLLLVNFPITWVVFFNFGKTLEWDIYPVSSSAFKYFKSLQLEENTEPLMISGDRLLEMSWGYHNVRSKQNIQPFAHSARDISHLSDYVLCHPINCDGFVENYMQVFEDESNMRILKRNKSLYLKPIYQLKNPLEIQNNSEYIDIIDLKDSAILQSANLLDLEVAFSANEVPLDVHLIITTSNSENDKLYYDFIPIKWIRDKWEGEKLRLRRPLAIPADSERLLIYAWNIDGVNQKMTVQSATLYHGTTR